MQRELPGWLPVALGRTVDAPAPVAGPSLAEPQAAVPGAREAAMIRILMQCNQAGAAQRMAAEIKLGGSAGDVTLHAALGRLAGRTGRWEEAVAELEQATSGGVNDASTWRQLALAYGHLGYHSAAAAALRHVLSENPNDEEARMVLASILLWIGQTEEGLSQLDRVSQAPRGREAEYTQLVAQARAIQGQRNTRLAHQASAASLLR
jgi:Flp pilus assembly protein TadD